MTEQPTERSTPQPRGGRTTAVMLMKNVSSNWAALLVNTTLSFFIAPFVVNRLGSVYYAIWALVMQFTGYLWLFDFGVRESVVKYVAQYHAAGDSEELESTVRTALTVYAFVACLGLLGSAALALALPHVFNIPVEAVPSARMTVFLVGASVAVSFVSNVFAGVLMGLQKFYLVARAGMLFSLCRAASIFGLLSIGLGIVSLSLVNLAMSFAYGFLVYRLSTKSLPEIRFRLSRLVRPQTMKLVHYGKWVLMSNLGDKFVFATDAIVIGMFLPISTLTFYAIAGTLIGHLRSVIQAMAVVISPLSSSLQVMKMSESLANVVQTGAKIAVVLGVPLCVGFVTLGERFVNLWMGPEYGPTAGAVLSVLTVGHLIGLPYATISAALYGINEHRIVAMTRIAEGSVNLGLSIWLVQKYGLIGVAIGTAIPQVIVVGLVLPMILRRRFSINLWHYYASVYVLPIFAAVPFVGACMAIERLVRPGNLIAFLLWAAAALVIYVIPSWFIAYTTEERARLIDGIRRRRRMWVSAPTVAS